MISEMIICKNLMFVVCVCEWRSLDTVPFDPEAREVCPDDGDGYLLSVEIIS